MNKVKIKHDNKTYFVIPVEDNPGRSNGGTSSIFMYRVVNENEKIIGCVTFTWSGTARVVTTSLVFKNDHEEEITYLALMPYLPFFPDLVKGLYPTCFRYMFNTMIDGLEKNKSGYSIGVQCGFMKTMQRIIFGGQPTDDQVRRQVLITLHNHWLDDPHTFIPLSIIILFVPVEIKVLERNLMFLLDEVLIDAIINSSTDPHTIETVKIKNKGIKHIEDSSEFSVKFPSEFVYQKFMGDNINASTSGKNSPVIIKSQNISIAFEEIEAEIKKTNISNKQEILVLLNQLKQEVVQKNDSEKIVGLLGEIKKRGSWLNEKILSHPLIAQIIAQALAKAVGIT